MTYWASARAKYNFRGCFAVTIKHISPNVVRQNIRSIICWPDRQNFDSKCSLSLGCTASSSQNAASAFCTIAVRPSAVSITINDSCYSQPAALVLPPDKGNSAPCFTSDKITRMFGCRIGCRQKIRHPIRISLQPILPAHQFLIIS